MTYAASRWWSRRVVWSSMETPSRKNAGAHYTPRSLGRGGRQARARAARLRARPACRPTTRRVEAEVQHGDPRPQGRRHRRGLGSVPRRRGPVPGDRVTEAWTDGGHARREAELANPQLAKDRAIREVIARCLYGADINPMAVEMCKLSLWLVSLDKTKPFSFVDDKIFCGNSLLGVTTSTSCATCTSTRTRSGRTAAALGRRRRQDRRSDAAAHENSPHRSTSTTRCARPRASFACSSSADEVTANCG